MKFTYKALSMSSLGILAAVASAQALSPGNPKYVNQVDSSLASYGTAVEVQDTVVTASGDRYITGRAVSGTNADAYLDKVSSRGQLIWHKTISYGLTDAGRAVALDADENVYVAVATGVTSVPHLLAYDSTGTFLADSAYVDPDTINDLVILPDGTPLSAGSYRASSSVSNPEMQVWDMSLATSSDYLWWNVTGAFASMGVDANGNVLFTGRFTNGSSKPNRPLIGMVTADLQYGQFTWDDTVSSVMKEIKVDPASGMAVAVGYYLSGTTHVPISMQLSGSFDAGTATFTLNVAETTNSGYGSAGADYQGVDIKDGMFYLLTDIGTNLGAKFFTLSAFTKNPAGVGLVSSWTDSVGGANNLAGYDVLAHEDRVTVAALDETVRTTGSGAYKGYNLFTWSKTGTREQRNILGASDQPIPTSYTTSTFPSETLSFGGGVFNLYAPSLASQAGLWAAGSIPGPDDSYTTLKNVAVVQTAWKGNLMENDQNGFVLGLTTTLTPGSTVNLSSVTVNPDGTFTATPATAFVGTAYFQYDVYNGATFVATHNVTIKVKNDHVPPVAVDDTPTVIMNSGINTILVLANDSDPGGSELTITGKTNAANGTVQLSADRKSVTYKPKKNFTGTDTFTYTIKNTAGDSATATVTVDVQQPS